VTPVVLGEFGWALASTTYSLIYARIGTESIAGVQYCSHRGRLGLGADHCADDAAAIMTGNRIGAGEENTASAYARKFVMLGAAAGVMVGVAARDPIGVVISLYNVGAVTQTYAQRLVLVLALAYWIKGCNFVMIAGVMRGAVATLATRFSWMWGGAWLVGIPLAATAAFILHLPVYWVAFVALSEEVVKIFFCVCRA